YVLGARALTLVGVDGTTGAASTIVDVTLELFGQLAYTALGLSFLIYVEPDAAIANPVAIGLAAAALLAAAFLVVQRRGFDLFDRFARVLARGRAGPNAVGVQEGAYSLLGASFGLTPEMALALSLLKRARDLTIGLPSLVAWQILESGRLWRRIASFQGQRGTGAFRLPKIEAPVGTTGASSSSAGCGDGAMSIVGVQSDKTMLGAYAAGAPRWQSISAKVTT